MALLSSVFDQTARYLETILNADREGDRLPLPSDETIAWTYLSFDKFVRLMQPDAIFFAPLCSRPIPYGPETESCRNYASGPEAPHC